MRINSLEIANFRNFERFSHKFSKNLTIFYGKNAAGKTNLLEAVRFLSFAKSFRAKRDADLIFWGKDFATAHGAMHSQEKDIEIHLALKRIGASAQKIIKINNSSYPVSRLVGKFVSVLFSPEDMMLISGAPGLRRHYLDVILAQVDNIYYHCLVELKKILLSRAKILFELKNHNAAPKELEFWNEKLIQYGSIVMLKRRELIESLNQAMRDSYKIISGNAEKELKIYYLSNIRFNSQEDLTENFKKELMLKSYEEIRREQNLCGPHRDDFIFLLSGRRLANFGSRGEFRSAILALKIAELKFLENQLGERPVLLLDDIFSELDAYRRNHLALIVEKQQTIITATELALVDGEFVEKGEVREIKF